MKNIIKRIIGKKLSRFLIFQKNKEYIPFTFKSFIDPENQYSDFFVYDTKIHKNYFIAENVFSLLNKELMTLNMFNIYEVLLPKFFTIIIAFVLGFLFAVTIFSIKIFALKMRLRSLNNKYKSLKLSSSNIGISSDNLKTKILKIFKLNDHQA